MEASPPKPSRARRRGLRAVLLLSPAVVFILLLALGVARRAEPPEIGDPAPDFTASRLEGHGSVTLSELRGRPVLLNFWASWCLPCRDEAPLLRRAHRLYGERVEFIGVDVRDARSDALDFARRHGLEYTLVRDGGRIAPAFGLTGQPETFLIGSGGNVVEHVPGPVFAADLYPLLDALVESEATG
jgi:cytochrome c biogenesis protein CcmG/thiol:disulfide interchange protein DsbE